MAVRVRCRCGQEIHLRYGEWVYVLLGLVLLCVVLNSLGLLLLYLNLDEWRGGQGEGPRADESSPAAGRLAPEDTPGGDGTGKAGERAEARPRRRGSPESSGQGDRRVTPSPSPAGESTRPDSLVDERSTLVSPEPDRDSTESAGAEAVQLDAPRSPAPPRIDLWSGLPLVADASPLLRLHLLDGVPGGLVWRAAFLLDHDARVRRRALERLRAYSERASAGVESETGPARAVLSLASEWLRSPAGDPELAPALDRLFAGARVDASETPDPAVVRPVLAARIAAFRNDPARGRAVPALVRVGTTGLDLVLLVDVSRSMRDALNEGRRQIRWLWPALAWALPKARVGLVLYRDDVVLHCAFAMPVEEQMARLDDAVATGGGDVPEGVDSAVELALSLGAFRWRPEAQKHIVVFGDAPPPYGRVTGLASLLRAAHEQGDFRVHALGVHPEVVQPELGRDDVPFFDEIARAGGGLSRTVQPGDLGREILLCVLRPTPAVEVESLARRLAVMFES